VFTVNKNSDTIKGQGKHKEQNGIKMQPNDNFGNVKRNETLTEQTYRRLRHALMTGTLSPGEKITGRRIASALNVSLTPAREAIGRLVVEGGLEPGRSLAALVPKLTKTKYREIIQVRILLEGLAAETSMQNFNAKLLAKLENIQRDITEATDCDQHQTILKKNADFHFLIYKTANMPTVLSIIDSLWLRIGPSMSLFSPDYQISRQGSRNHQEVLEAIRQGNAENLRSAIVKDLNDGTDYLMPLLDDN
jgi:GntR family colanic acid and biofilm gene transcriptional regulator